MQELIVFATTLLLLATTTAAVSENSEIPAPEVGNKAPDFSLPWTTKDKIHFQDKLNLTDRLGKGYIILAFFPAAWTGG